MNPTPRCYIWVIAIILFSCIVSGGIFLALYMIQPETPATTWYPAIGIVLVCLPWFFWVLTVLYRILSRSLGFRMVCWGDGNDSPASAVEDGGGLEDSKTDNVVADDTVQGENSRQVQFGEAVVIGEHDNSLAHDASYGGGSSKASHESERPLKLSMAS